MNETIKMSPIDELLEIGARMKRDKPRLEELCRQIADASDPADGPGLDEAQAVRKTARRGTVRKRAASEVYEGQRYPVLHRNPESHEVCKGSFQAVTAEVTGLTSHE